MDISTKKLKERRCSYCGKSDELFGLNDFEELLCVDCYIPHKKIQQSKDTLCSILNISSTDVFEYKRDIYKIRMVNFKQGKHISIPCVMRLNCYCKCLFEINENTQLDELNIDYAFNNIIDGREFFEMLVENYRIKIIPKDEIIKRLIQCRRKLG